jgi:ZIP family zinc transporter
MLDELSALPLVLVGLLGSLVAGLGTALGAVPIFLRARWSPIAQTLMLALAAGVMLGATVFSLLIPALDVVMARTGSETRAALVASGGIVLGALAMSLVHACVPHEHFVKGPENQGAGGFRLGKNWLFVLAITLHNFPEGMSVGVAYGGGYDSGVAVTIGIGLQNLPEGLAVAAALIGDGFSRSRAFWIAALTGMVEPAGGLLGAAAIGLSDALLPWGLTFAAGAMLFVISGEIIPETHRSGAEQRATFSLVVGFILMMMLDVTLG